MKFIVSSTALLSHLQAISRVINTKNSMAILDNFLFRLEGNSLTMTASDQETTMTTTIEVLEAEGQGLFAVSAKILLEPLKELPDQPLTFEINDENEKLLAAFKEANMIDNYEESSEKEGYYKITRPKPAAKTLPKELL